MGSRIINIYYREDCLPYKDSERTVHFPIAGTGFLGASNTTKIKFYYDELDNLDETTWVAVSKLPNGKLGSRVLESYLDEELNEHYALLELDNYYTQYKGDVFISLQGYQGGVDFDYDEENSQYEIHGTPTIAATGSIKFTINYANQFVGSGETDNINFQRILAALGTKLGMRAYSEHVEELPSEGSPDIFYVVNDDPNNPNLQNIYIWNENTKHYIWVGDNTLDLGNYYTKDEGQDFENEIETGLKQVQNELSGIASGSPSGVYDTVADLTTAHPTGDNKIYVVLADGKWYYWNSTTSTWTAGGDYLSTGNALSTTDVPTRYIGTVFSGDYFTDTVIMTYPEYKPGDVIDYKIKAYDGESGCVVLYDSTGTVLGIIGRSSSLPGESETTSSYTIPADFAYAKTNATNYYQTNKVVNISYIINRTSTIALKTKLYDYLGLVKSNKYANGSILFTSLDVKPGDIISYNFNRQLYEVGCIVIKDSAGNYLNIIGQPSSGQAGQTNYVGEYTIPADFAYAEVVASEQYSEDDYIDVLYLYKKDSIINDLDQIYKRKDELNYQKVDLSYFNNIIDGSGNQNFANSNFCGSNFVKLIGGKIKVSFASPWTVYIVFYESINFVQAASSTWLTAGTHILDVPSDKPYLKIFVSKTGYNTPIDPDDVPEAITVEASGKIIQKSLSKYTLATLGDSITYGTKPDTDSGQIDNPWFNRVANLLQLGNIINCGVPSARVLGFPTPNTPPRIWSTQVNTIPEQADIVSVLIGINDMLSAKESVPGYVLGQMSDRDGNSFYGGLHMMWQDLIERYPPSSGKKLFMIMYPYMPGYESLWDDWMGACIEVAKYYGIPILDLRDKLGISVAGDTDQTYWLIKNGQVDAHPTQECANLFADAIANFMESHFGINDR